MQTIGYLTLYRIFDKHMGTFPEGQHYLSAAGENIILYYIILFYYYYVMKIDILDPSVEVFTQQIAFYRSVKSRF